MGKRETGPRPVRKDEAPGNCGGKPVPQETSEDGASAPPSVHPTGPLLFMGQVEDPELNVLFARGVVHVYGVNRTTVNTDWPRAPARPNPDAGLWVMQNDGSFVRCGCDRCFYGPCPSPATGGT